MIEFIFNYYGVVATISFFVAIYFVWRCSREASAKNVLLSMVFGTIVMSGLGLGAHESYTPKHEKVVIDAIHAAYEKDVQLLINEIKTSLENNTDATTAMVALYDTHDKFIKSLAQHNSMNTVEYAIMYSEIDFKVLHDSIKNKKSLRNSMILKKVMYTNRRYCGT